MRKLHVLLVAGLLAGACGDAADDLPPDLADSVTAVPPANLPADSDVVTPVPVDNAETSGVPDAAGRSPSEVNSSTDPQQPGGSPAAATGGATSQPDGAGAGQDAPESAAILRRAAAAYENVRSIEADFVMNYQNRLLKQNITSRGRLYQRRPDRIALRFTDPAGDLIVGDGQHFYMYYPSVDADQVVRAPAGAAEGTGVDLQAQFLGDPVQRFQHTLHGREDVGGRSAYVLTLVPRERGEFRSLKVWLDTRDSLARRFEITEHNGVVRRFELDDMRLNTTIPDATFRFTPPPGVRIVNAGQ